MMAEETFNQIDGYAVVLRIIPDGKRFSVELITRSEGEAGAWVEAWRGVPAVGFRTPLEAARHGQYILMGIKAVRGNGEPVLTVT